MDLDDLDEFDAQDLEDLDLAPKPDSLKSWVEKYRPSKLDDVVYQHEVINSLKNIIEDNASNLPNLLFYGPPGTGKTSTIVALSREIFGDQCQARVLELNASDERGIQVIRDKVKNFAQQTVLQQDTSKIPPIKIVVLDECDSMTRDAQSALRRTMEKYSTTTRFCLICNYVSKIIDPIVSRCTVFRFKPLQQKLIEKTLIDVCHGEGYQINNSALKSLTSISEGDLRRAITLLQTATLITDRRQEIEESVILEISGHVPLNEIEQFFNTCSLKSYVKMTDYVEFFIKEGYSASQFLSQLQDWIATADNAMLSDRQKGAICERIAFNDKRLLDGGDEYILIADVGATIIKQLVEAR